MIFILQAKLSSPFFRYFFLFGFFFLIYSIEITEAVSFYLQGDGFNERFFFHFNLQLIKNSWSVYPSVTIIIILALVLLGLLLKSISIKPFFNNWPLSLVLILIVISVLLNSSIHNFIKFIWQEKYSQFDIPQLSGKNLNQFGLNPRAINQQLDDVVSGKNLVLIYLESLEKIYQEAGIFKGLTPNLLNYNQQGLVFNNIQQYKGTGWTIAGIVSSQCGTPLLYEYSMISSNDIMAEAFLNKVICLGDVLNKAGYYQIYLGGANKKFAGKVNFLSSHGYDEVKGMNDLKVQLKDPSYMTSWGLYDDSLFDIAADEFFRLSKLNKPFNLTLLTLDSHHPTGHASKSCSPYIGINNSMVQAIYCTDQLLKRFLDKISQAPAYKNTVVVLFSDHLAMRNDAEKLYPAAYKRKLTFTILNTGQVGVNKQLGFHMDVAPTIIDALNIQQDSQFLMGNSLISQKYKNSTELEQNEDRYNLIKHINSTYLTKLDKQAQYEGKYIVNQLADKFLLMGEELSIPFGQQKLKIDELEKNRALLIYFDDDGIIQYTKLTDIAILPYILYMAKNSNFLLIMPTTELPFSFTSNMDRTKHTHVFMGNLSKQVTYLSGFNSQSDIKVKSHDFYNHLSLMHTAKREHDKYAIDKFCSKQGLNSAFYDQENKQIVMPAVRVGAEYYQAVLKKKDAQTLEMSALDRIEDSVVTNQHDYCHAFYASTDYTLYIPSLIIDNQKYALQLNLKSEGPVQFEIPRILRDKL
ncbi:MAG: sulfatase-like hydrolase/transferase [Pseudomonadota bacterium]